MTGSERTRRAGWWVRRGVLLVLLNASLAGAVSDADVRAERLQAPPPPATPPKLVNLQPVALQGGRTVSIMFPVVLPRDPTYAGSGGKGGPLGGRSGRFMAEYLKLISPLGASRALSCTGQIPGRPARAFLALGYEGFPRAVPAAIERKWAAVMKDTKTVVPAVGSCSWSFGWGERAKLAGLVVKGSWTMKYGEFWGGTPGTISKSFTIRGMCDRPGCPITRANPYVVLKVSP